MDEMHPRLVLVVFGISFAFFLAIVALVATAAGRRRRDLEATARRMGFTFQAEDPRLLAELGQFRLFPAASNGRLANFLTGRAGPVEVRVVDYRCDVGGLTGPESCHTVAVLRAPGTDLPSFCLSRPVLGIDLAASPRERKGLLPGAHGSPVEFPEDPFFESVFVVRGEGQEVRRLLDDEVRLHLARFSREHVGLEGWRDLLLFTRWRPVDPEKIRDLLDEAVAIHGLLARRAAAR